MVVPDSMTRRTQDGYEDKFGKYQPLLPRARFNERVLREVDTEGVKLAEDWKGQTEITGKDAFGCHGSEARKVAEGGGSRLSGPTGAQGGEGGGSR